MAPSAPALYEADIAGNAGAMLRTCACLGVAAAIIEPASFPASDRHFRRFGVDYLDHVASDRQGSWRAFSQWRRAHEKKLALLTTKAAETLWDFAFRCDDIMLVGRESTGIPPGVRQAADARVRMAMQPGVCAPNVAFAAAIALSEAPRQLAHSEGATG